MKRVVCLTCCEPEAFVDEDDRDEWVLIHQVRPGHHPVLIPDDPGPQGHHPRYDPSHQHY